MVIVLGRVLIGIYRFFGVAYAPQGKKAQGT